MATYQEQIEKYEKNKARASAEVALNTLSNSFINALLPFEKRGELTITTDLLVALVHAVADAAGKDRSHER